MTNFDVFNGDADGICALHQMRLANPIESTLITGIKRDISLLKNVQAAAGDQVLVLDISLDKNRSDLERLLSQNTHVQYFDHHFAGEIPINKNLVATINTDANTCTSLLVNNHLKQQFLPWAVTAAFGDNLHQSAHTAAMPLNLTKEQLNQLEQLGTCINYNGYGSNLDDLIFTPDALYKIISNYENPFDFISSDNAFVALLNGYNEDISNIQTCKPDYETSSHSVTLLPNEKWARRVSGVYANKLATEHHSRAHAMLTLQADNSYVVSVRAPLSNKTGADELCRQFETGGGRKAAAGINRLAVEDYDKFIEKFTQAFV